MAEAELNQKKHNNFFLSVMSNALVAKEFFAEHLPSDIKQKIDFNSLLLCKETYVDRALRLSQVDVLFKVNFDKKKSGFIYILCEHQSTCDRRMAFRMLKYMVKIMDHHVKQQKNIKLPVIFPIVLYHGKAAYYGTTDLFDLFGENKKLAKNIFLKPFRLVDLSQIPDEELERSQYAGVVQYIFKHIFARDIGACLEQISSQLRFLENEQISADLLTSILKYVIMARAAKDKTKVISFIEKTFSTQTSKKMITIADQLKLDGIQEGIQQGHQQGIQQAALKMLQKNIQVNEIADITGLSIEKITELKRKNLGGKDIN